MIEVQLTAPTTELRVEEFGDEGMQLIPNRPATVYFSFAEGFSVGFGEDGAFCDIDSHLDTSQGQPDDFDPQIDRQMHAVRLAKPIDADGDVISAGRTSPRIDSQVGIWWCAVDTARVAVRVGENVYALLGDNRTTLVGMAVARSD